MSDPITLALGAIKALEELFGRLLKAPDARRQERFKWVDEMSDQLRTVHLGYNKMILETRRKFGRLESEWTRTPVPPYPVSLAQLAELRAVIADFRDARAVDEALRDSLRSRAEDLFKSISDKAERRYLCVVIYYFLGNGGLDPTDAQLDHDVENVIEKGGNTQWDTPSTQLYLRLGAMAGEERFQVYDTTIVDLREISSRMVALLDRYNAELNQSFVNAERRFQQVALAVNKETMPKV